MAFMGHTGDTSSHYLEQDSSIFEKMYVKIEPLLTVFGVNQNVVNEMSKEVNGLKNEVAVLAKGGEAITDRTAQLETEVKDLKEKLECAVAYIWTLRDEVEQQEKLEAQEDFNKLVEEINKEHPVPKKAKTSQKISEVK